MIEVGNIYIYIIIINDDDDDIAHIYTCVVFKKKIE
jgi:hypothetical protein